MAELEHYGIKGMEWGKKKKRPASGVVSGISSKVTSDISKAFQSKASQERSKNMYKGLASSATLAIRQAASGSIKKRQVTQQTKSGAVKGITSNMNSVVDTTRKYANARMAASGTAAGAASNIAETVAKKTNQIAKKTEAERMKQQAAAQEKLKEAAKRVAATGGKKASEISTATGSIAAKGNKVIAAMFTNKVTTAIGRATSSTISSRAESTKKKAKKTVSKQEWRNR